MNKIIRALTQLRMGVNFLAVVLSGSDTRSIGSLPLAARASALCSSLLLALAPAFNAEAASVLTHHNDNFRTGGNLSETILKPSMYWTNFGKLFSQSVDGPINTQPLYVDNVLITAGWATGTVHNVVYVATMNNSVFAFDADANVIPLWQTWLGDPFVDPSGVNPTTGIMSTPVIDAGSNTIYVVSKNASPGGPEFWLHALDITNGTRRIGTVQIGGSLPGVGWDSSGGNVTFRARDVVNRPALLLANGQVYIMFGALELDRGALGDGMYHGWAFSYSASTLARTGIFGTSLDAKGTGIWMSGNGPVADENGSIYAITGNSWSYSGHSGLDVRSGGRNVGESIIKLNSNLTTLQSWFMPCNADRLDGIDYDFGSSGPLKIPGRNVIIVIGKEPILYLLDTGGLGGYNSTPACPYQQHVLGFRWLNSDLPDGHTHNGLVYWGRPLPSASLAYIWREGTPLPTPPPSAANNSPLAAYFVTPDGLVGVPPAARSTMTTSGGAALSLSANGYLDGILWALADTYGVSVLRAFDASNVANEFWNSSNLARDSVGGTKWNPPTVANGKVYVGTLSNTLHFYGVLPPGLSLVSPDRGWNTGGTSVTITGSNFGPDATVLFGGVAARNVTFVNTTTLTAITPAHAIGPVEVRVTVYGQTATLASAFRYQIHPALMEIINNVLQ